MGVKAIFSSLLYSLTVELSHELSTRGKEDKLCLLHPIWLIYMAELCSGWKVKLPCSSAIQGGWEGSSREETEQTKPLLCFPGSWVTHLRWYSCLTAVGATLSIFKSSVNWLLKLFEKCHIRCPAPLKVLKTYQNPHLTPFPAKNCQQLRVPEMSFPLNHGPSVPCWQHKRIGVWNLSLRKTLSRRTACVFLCPIVP